MNELPPAPANEKVAPPAFAEVPGSAFFATKYRIVTDNYCGYEAQYRMWWWPWWLECNGSNTCGTIEASERLAANHRGNAYPGKVVKYLFGPNTKGSRAEERE